MITLTLNQSRLVTFILKQSQKTICIYLSLTSNRMNIFITGRNATASVHRGRQDKKKKKRFYFNCRLLQDETEVLFNHHGSTSLLK